VESFARRWWPLLLPASYLLHLVEEWFGGEGFAVWTRRALGQPVSTTRFLILNAVVWPLFTALTLAAIKKPAVSWFLTSFGTIVVINALLHGFGTLASSSYSPGLVTGLLLYLPLGSLAIRRGLHQLPSGAFARAVFLGVAAHAVVALIAFA
jgi:hypothetical protein